LSREARLAREAIQNSCGASMRDGGNLSAGPVKVSFMKRSLTGRRKAEFADILGMRGPRARVASLGLPKRNSFTLLDDPDAALHLMVIEDWNTVGLGGAISGFEGDDHFWRLFFTVGDDAKAHGAQSSGGSFGFGKGVYASTADTYSFPVTLVH
jgi:hypothetical protein